MLMLLTFKMERHLRGHLRLDLLIDFSLFCWLVLFVGLWALHWCIIGTVCLLCWHNHDLLLLRWNRIAIFVNDHLTVGIIQRTPRRSRLRLHHTNLLLLLLELVDRVCRHANRNTLSDVLLVHLRLRLLHGHYYLLKLLHLLHGHLHLRLLRLHFSSVCILSFLEDRCPAQMLKAYYNREGNQDALNNSGNEH